MEVDRCISSGTVRLPVLSLFRHSQPLVMLRSCCIDAELELSTWSRDFNISDGWNAPTGTETKYCVATQWSRNIPLRAGWTMLRDMTAHALLFETHIRGF